MQEAIVYLIIVLLFVVACAIAVAYVSTKAVLF
jgi:hypothetical protein